MTCVLKDNNYGYSYMPGLLLNALCILFNAHSDADEACTAVLPAVQTRPLALGVAEKLVQGYLAKEVWRKHLNARDSTLTTAEGTFFIQAESLLRVKEGAIK